VHLAAAVCRTVHGRVVDDDELPVAAATYIELDNVGAQAQGRLERRECVLGSMAGRAPVTDTHFSSCPGSFNLEHGDLPVNADANARQLIERRMRRMVPGSAGKEPDPGTGR